MFVFRPPAPPTEETLQRPMQIFPTWVRDVCLVIPPPTPFGPIVTESDPPDKISVTSGLQIWQSLQNPTFFFDGRGRWPIAMSQSGVPKPKMSKKHRFSILLHPSRRQFPSIPSHQIAILPVPIVRMRTLQRRMQSRKRFARTRATRSKGLLIQK